MLAAYCMAISGSYCYQQEGAGSHERKTLIQCHFSHKRENRPPKSADLSFIYFSFYLQAMAHLLKYQRTIYKIKLDHFVENCATNLNGNIVEKRTAHRNIRAEFFDKQESDTF